jgi:uncharacterized protein YqeY
MTIEVLNKDMITAWKSGDLARKSTLANMIDAVKKASMTSKGRVEITEQLVNETLIKYQKTVQEQYDTCPSTAEDPKRSDELKTRKACYLKELELVKQYAPQRVTDCEEIKCMINDIVKVDPNMTLTKTNKGYVMKTLAANLNGKADMAVVSKVVGEMLV